MTLKVLEIGGHAAGYAGRLFVRAGAEVRRVPGPGLWPGWASEKALDLFLHGGKTAGSLNDVQGSDIVVVDAAGASALQGSGYDDWCVPIKVSITPYGRTGPKRDWLATPSTLLATGGYTYLMGDPDRAPLTLPGHYLEFQAGALAFSAAMANAYASTSTSTSTSADVDIGMLEVLMSLSQFTTVRWHCAGDIRQRHGSDFWFVAPSDLFRCADGWVYVNIVPNFWDPFVALVGRPELLLDERFQGNDARMANREPLYAVLREVFAGLSRAEIETQAQACRVPLGVVRTLQQVLEEPHLAQRGFWERVTDVEGTAVRSPGSPFHEAHRTRAEYHLSAVTGTSRG